MANPGNGFLDNKAVLGLCIAMGLTFGGWLLGTQIKATRLSDRYVSVKGLVERKVKSDLAIWPLAFKVAGDDLSTLYTRTESDKKAILQFLTEQGVEAKEVEVGAIRQANQGVFSILAADGGEGSDGQGGPDASLMKTVRVVTSVDYYLNN